MILIVDGYNLMFHERWPIQSGSLEDRRNDLVKKVAIYRREHQIRRTIVVFDGSQGVIYENQQRREKGVEVIYATGLGRADEEIIDLSACLNDVHVVTADRRLAQQARRNRAQIIETDQFIHQLHHNPLSRKKNTPEKPSPQQVNVEEWLEIFQMEEEITISSLKNPSSRKNKPSSNNHKPPKRKSPDSSSSSQHRKSKSKKKEKKKTKHSCDCPEEFSDDLLPEDMPDEMTIDEWSKWLDLD